MRISFEKKMGSLDKLFTSLFLFSPVVCQLAISLGVDPRLVWFNVLMFFLWTVYIYWYRGVYQFQEEKELSFIERARGVSYFVSFIPTFILNGFVVFYPSTVNRLVVIVLVGISLIIIEGVVPRTVFSKQTSLFKKEQRIRFRKVLSLTGSVSIYFSAVVASISLLGFENTGSNAVIWFGLGVIFLLPLIFIYQRETKSRELAENLAESLKDTGWLQLFLRQKRIDLRKQRKKKTGRT